MLKWTSVLLGTALMVASLFALGVGGKAMAELAAALLVMGGVALLIAWPFLARAGQEQRAAESHADAPR